MPRQLAARRETAACCDAEPQPTGTPATKPWQLPGSSRELQLACQMAKVKVKVKVTPEGDGEGDGENESDGEA